MHHRPEHPSPDHPSGWKLSAGTTAKPQARFYPSRFRRWNPEGVFGQLVELPHSSLGPHQPEAMVAGSRRSLIVCTPMGMVLELVRSMSLINVATDQMQLPEENSAAPVHG